MKDIILKDKKLVIVALIFFILFLFIIFNLFLSNPKGIYTIKYRTKNSNDNWSRWVKNGKTSGNKLDDIQAIGFKVSEKEGSVDIAYFTKDKWTDTTKNTKNIKGVKLTLLGNLRQKYDICYRTYNKKNKWLEWTCNAEISGNKKENITAIEIKIIPNNIVKNEYLKDYDNNKNESSIGF